METGIVAWAGVVLGFLSLGWHIYTHQMNRGRLKITAALITHHPGAKKDVSCMATNHGPRPIIVTEIGVQFENRGIIMFGQQFGFPQRLDSGEWHSVQFDFDPETDGKILDAWAKDSLSKKYRLNRRDRADLIKSAT
jgi:hypothetical protein